MNEVSGRPWMLAGDAIIINAENFGTSSLNFKLASNSKDTSHTRSSNVDIAVLGPCNMTVFTSCEAATQAALAVEEERKTKNVLVKISNIANVCKSPGP
eukprot:CAMPEP_0203943718 /NCGR_PEP_ID=MMETSP0359-20131031/79630_1 /ASSEMBLY_ACC=CAM_ASM_000338 /TAXON_ID=268821 /ORGANISM="Scrippsiella Hangoei, Strain SHTV-5" /LENGTH=98 /DNA_ID=CAMNT_0050874645 /DNA_START=142 /DNA_END=438 /DNA_ORIENTATION=-